MAVLKGIKKIAVYLDVSIPTVYRYICDYNLPVRKISNHPSATVITTTGLVDKWIEESLPDNSKAI